MSGRGSVLRLHYSYCDCANLNKGHRGKYYYERAEQLHLGNDCILLVNLESNSSTAFC
jgi:hypothetical protein